MSSPFKIVLLFAAALALTACVAPDKYPVSGEECGPEDPVKEIDASMADCAPNL